MKTPNDSLFDVSGFSYNPSTGLIFHNGHQRGFYASDSRYLHIEIKGVRVKAHRLAWRLHYGQWPPFWLDMDHRNLKKDDNRIQNLRLATRSQNRAHGPANKTGRSGERCVHWNAKSGKWEVGVNKEGERITGFASHKISAIVAARLIRRILHGEFAAQEAA